MISYPNYKYIFPVKALGMYAMRSGNQPLGGAAAVAAAETEAVGRQKAETET